LLADKNALGSVVAIFVVTGVRASPCHVDPCRVGRRRFSTQGVSMRELVISTSTFDAAIDATASAARAYSGLKSCAANRAGSSFFHKKIVPRNKFKGRLEL
jgi:hypothetical protein